MFLSEKQWNALQVSPSSTEGLGMILLVSGTNLCKLMPGAQGNYIRLVRAVSYMKKQYDEEIGFQPQVISPKCPQVLNRRAMTLNQSKNGYSLSLNFR